MHLRTGLHRAKFLAPFLKYLDALEHDKVTEAELEGKKYAYILDPAYRWAKWAAPKGRNGQIDHNTAQTGDDLRDFVNLKLFPYLHGFKQQAASPRKTSPSIRAFAWLGYS